MKIELEIGKVVELENGLMYTIEMESNTPMGSKIYGTNAVHYEWTKDGICLHNSYDLKVRRCEYANSPTTRLGALGENDAFVIRRVRSDGKVIDCATTHHGEIADTCGNSYPRDTYLRFWDIINKDQLTIFPMTNKLLSANGEHMVLMSDEGWHYLGDSQKNGDGGYIIGGKTYDKHGIYHYGKHISYVKEVGPHLTDRTCMWALQEMRLGQNVRAIDWKDETAYLFMKNGKIYEHATTGSGMTEDEFIKNVGVASSWEIYNPITLTNGHVCALVGGKWGQIGNHNRVVIDNDIVIEYSMHGRPLNMQIGEGEIKEILKPEAGMYINYVTPMPTYGNFKWALVNRALGFTVCNKKMGITMHPTQNCPQPDEEWLEDMMEMMHQDMYEGWE